MAIFNSAKRVRSLFQNRGRAFARRSDGNERIGRRPLFENLEQRLTFSTTYYGQFTVGGPSLSIADRSDSTNYVARTLVDELEDAGELVQLTRVDFNPTAPNLPGYYSTSPVGLPFDIEVGVDADGVAKLGSDYELYWRAWKHGNGQQPSELLPPEKVEGSFTMAAGTAGYGFLYIKPLRKPENDPVEGDEPLYIRLTSVSADETDPDVEFAVDDQKDHLWAVISDSQPWENQVYCQCDCGEEGDTISKVGPLNGAAGLKHLIGDDLNMMYWSPEDMKQYVTFKAFVPYYQAQIPTLVQAVVTMGTESETVYIDFPAATELDEKVTFTFQLPADSSLQSDVYNWSVNLTYGTNSGGTFVPLDALYGNSDTYTGRNIYVNRHSGGFGDGWAIEGIDSLKILSGDVLLLTGEGNAFFYENDGSGGFKRPNGEPNFSTLVYNSGANTYSLTDKFGTVSVFDSAGFLDYRDDKNGNRIDYTVSDGKYTQILDPKRGIVTFTYDGSNRLTGLTEFSGTSQTRTTTFTTDSNGFLRLISSADPTSGLKGPQTSFEYYPSTDIVTGQFEDHLKAVRIHSNWVDPATYITSPPAADDRDRVTTLKYDRTGGVAEITSKPTDPNAAREFKSMNAARILAQRSTSTSGSSVTNRAQFSTIDTELEQQGSGLNINDLIGVDGKRTDHHGVEQDFTTDHLGYDSVTPLGEILITYIRDLDGLVTKSTTGDPDGSGSLVGLVSDYTYDSKGNVLTGTTHAAGSDAILSIHTWTYDSNYAQATKHVDELERVTKYQIGSPSDSIEKRGKVLSMTQVLGLDDSQSTERDDIVTKYSYTTATTPVYPQPSGYTPAGLVETIIDPLSRVTKYQYDVHGSNTRTFYNLGSPTQADVVYEYNDQLLQTSMTDELDRTTHWAYDALGRLVTMTEPDPDGPTGSLIAPVTTYEYDSRGNQIRVTDPLGNVTRKTYNKFNNVVHEIGPPANTTSSNAKTIDNGQSNFVATGWVSGPSGFGGSTVKRSGGTAGTAEWTFTVPDAGKYYDLLVTWPASLSNSAGAVFKVRDGSGVLLGTITVDQRFAPIDDTLAGAKWHSLGVFSGSTTYKVELDSGASTSGDVVADAARFAEATVTKHEYDFFGNRTGVTDPLGRRTEYTNDTQFKRQIAVTQPDPDGTTGPLPRPSPRPNTIRMVVSNARLTPSEMRPPTSTTNLDARYGSRLPIPTDRLAHCKHPSRNIFTTLQAN